VSALPLGVWARPGTGRISYVYVLAASHSGSTLLAMLLNAHPEVVTVGELVSGGRWDPASYRCSCRALIRECPFWQRVTEVVSRSQPGFDVASFGIRLAAEAPWWVHRLWRLRHRGPAVERVRDLLMATGAWRRHFADASRGFPALAATILDLARGRIIVDTSKLAHLLKYVRQVPELDVKVVHLVRDGRAVALAYMDQDNFADSRDPALRRGGFGKASAAPADLPMSLAADQWRWCLRSAEFALAGLDPSQWIRVHYEDLCRQPESTMRRILNFIGADPRRTVPDFRSVEHHVVGNGMRLDSTSEIRLDERWRSVLGEADLRIFDGVAGEANQRYGYR